MTEQNTTKRHPKGRSVKATAMPDLERQFSPEQLASAIRAKRTKMKLSLESVSDVLSISKPTLIKIEKADINVTLSTLLQVMEYLGLSFAVVSDDVEHSINEGHADDEWF